MLPSVPTDLPASEGASPDAGPSPLLQVPPRELSLFLSSSFVLPSYTGVFLVLLGV